MTAHAWVFPILTLAVFLAVWPASVATAAFLPAPLLLSTLVAYTSRKPGRWLFALAVISELFSTQPFGVMTAVVFLPWAARRLTPRLEVGFSGWFFLFLLAVSALQAFCLFAANFFQGWQFWPWPAAFVSALTAAAAAFGLLVVRTFVLPLPWPR